MPVGSGQNTNLLPIGWAVTLAQTNQLVLPANATRTGLIFVCSGTVAVAITPAAVNTIPVATAPATVSLPSGGLANPTLPASGVAVINGAGSVTMQPGDKFIIDNMVCGCAWNGVAAAATGGSLAILEML